MHKHVTLKYEHRANLANSLLYYNKKAYEIKQVYKQTLYYHYTTHHVNNIAFFWSSLFLMFLDVC